MLSGLSEMFTLESKHELKYTLTFNIIYLYNNQKNLSKTSKIDLKEASPYFRIWTDFSGYYTTTFYQLKFVLKFQQLFFHMKKKIFLLKYNFFAIFT